ncbi:unnamed protein product [Rhizoctonia solani]|uniref:Synaptobrevin homolog YKT6 n=1 Tax=Rhizoctonia solani TaxID=456999 RepID=A0A8H3C3I6_9AGAM|nr:unnamed protein product [Rhizoctonia solani]
MSFFTGTVAERTPAGQRQSIQEKSYTFHVYNRGGAENLVGVLISDEEYPVRPAFSLLAKALDDFATVSIGVLISDEEYPVRPAFSLLAKALDDFATAVPMSAYSNPSAISFPQAQTYVAKYQEPKQADAIMKVQQELDETKIVLHKTIEAVLEKLDDLVDRSNNLSMSSKQFYKSAKKVCLLLSILNTR